MKLAVGEALQCPTILNNGFGDHRIEGISGIANVLCCVKMAKYYKFTARDVVVTVLTDSASMYGSRVVELDALIDQFNTASGVLNQLRDKNHPFRPISGLFRTERMDFYDEKRPLCQMRPLRQGVRGRARPDHLRVRRNSGY